MAKIACSFKADMFNNVVNESVPEETWIVGKTRNPNLSFVFLGETPKF